MKFGGFFEDDFGFKVGPLGSRSLLLKIEKLYMLNNFSLERDIVMKIAV